MRTSLFYALNGALGVVAHESLAYFKIDSGKEEYHHSLDGCGKHGKHKWVPDPSTFVFPQHDYKPGNSWDLCVDSAHCAPHEALSKVYFDFKDNSIVFDFKHIEHYKYEDVVVYIERGKPPGEHSQKYSKESDHCVILHDYKQAKCQIPYFSLTDGGSYDELCPIKDNGGWRLYIKIKAKISHGYKKYGLYNRAGDVHEKYFTLSYTCAECKDYKHEGKYELLEEGHEKKKYDGYKDEKKYKEYKDEKKYNDYKYEEGDKKYKRGIKDYDGEKYDHEHHKHHHKHYDHGHHGYDHDEHHYGHHDKHHDDDYDHEHKHKHHNPYKHDHDKDYEHSYHHGHHYGHHDNEHKHYNHGHHHGHHGDYKHHEHYDPSRHHDFNAFLNSYFDEYGHHDYNNGKHHYKHHDGYNHHHARGLDSEETKNGEKSEKLEQNSDYENKHKHHHHGHHHDHKHDHLHKHRHSHYDYHHYEHYDPGYYYHHEYKHHDHKNHGHKDYNNYDHENYDHKHHNHKHHDHKDYDNKDHDNKDYGHHHGHHKHYEHYDPSYHHDHHKHHDYKHGDKYDHHHHSKRSSHEYQHHGKHHEEPPVTVYYKEKAEDVNAQANHVIYEKEQKHEIPAHIYKKLAEASKKQQYDHEKKHAYEHNHKHIHEDHKHAEENYHQMKLAEAKLSQAIEEYYAIRYGKQHNEAHGHKKHEYHHKEPEHKHYTGGHYAHKEHKPAHEHHYGHYEHKPEHHQHHGHYDHHEHKPEKGYYERKEFEHKKENEHNKYSPKEYEPSKYYHAHHEPSYYHDKKEFQKHYNHDDGNVHVAFEKLWKEKASHQQKQNEKCAAVHYEQHPHMHGHYSKRSALPGHGDEVVEIDTAKVDKYIAKAEYNINDGISKAIYKAINSAGEDPTTGTIIKFYKKVEKAIKYIVFKNLKKTVHHITHVDGIREPESHEVDKKIYKAIKHILEAADEIFTKTIDALGEDPTEKEIEYAVAKVEKLLAWVVDKYVREAIIEIFDLEYITENSYGYYEKHEKYEKRQVQNVTESASNATATVANSTVEAASKKENQAANGFMKLFVRQDSQNATAVNTTAEASNATETQTLMRFMRRQEPSVKNATEASINATAQAVADVSEAVNATAEAANVTETQTLLRFMRRQDQKTTGSPTNTTAQAVADVEQALNATSQAAIGKKNGKRDGAKFYNGYVPECKGKVIKAYGIDGQHSAPMEEFASDTHPNTCYKHHGDYVLYSYNELKGTMYGKLYESNGGDKKFGNYFIEMVKGRDSYAEEIVVSIDIHDKYQYEITEARVYVGCTPGTDDHHGSNICSEKTYPYMSVAEKGLNEFVFAFPDVYACDEYFIAIVVDFCDNKYSS